MMTRVERLTATKASELTGIDRRLLRDAFLDGRIRGYRRQGQRLVYEFLIRELLEDLEKLPRCLIDGCLRPAIAKNKGCPAHSQRLSGSKISTTKRGPGEERSCELCEKSIGFVPQWRIRVGRGRFCSLSHAKLWEIQNNPEAYGLGAGQGPSEHPCAICGGPVLRYPSQVAKAELEKRRFVCAECFPLWRRALMAARRAVDRLDPKAERLPRSSELERLNEVAREYEEWIRTVCPKPGRPRVYATVLIDEALYERGFTDTQLDEILGANSPRYSETLRHRHGIVRRVPDAAWPARQAA